MSFYQAPASEEKPYEICVFVGGLPGDATYQEVREMCSQYGKTSRVFLQFNKKTNEFNGNAFVRFVNRQDGLDFMKHTNLTTMRGHVLNVNIANGPAPAQQPPRGPPPPPPRSSRDNYDSRYPPARDYGYPPRDPYGDRSFQPYPPRDSRDPRDFRGPPSDFDSRNPRDSRDPRDYDPRGGSRRIDDRDYPGRAATGPPPGIPDPYYRDMMPDYARSFNYPPAPGVPPAPLPPGVSAPGDIPISPDNRQDFAQNRPYPDPDRYRIPNPYQNYDQAYFQPPPPPLHPANPPPASNIPQNPNAPRDPRDPGVAANLAAKEPRDNAPNPGNGNMPTDGYGQMQRGDYGRNDYTGYPDAYSYGAYQQMQRGVR